MQGAAQGKGKVEHEGGDSRKAGLESRAKASLDRASNRDPAKTSKGGQKRGNWELSRAMGLS